MTLRQTLLLVAALNFAAFFGEAMLAYLIGAVSLIADSADFLEDASLNLLVVFGLGWTALWRKRLGIGLAVLLLLPAFAGLFMAAGKLSGAIGIDLGIAPMEGYVDVIPNANWLTMAGFAALAVNLLAAVLLVRVREAGGSLVRAAYLSARNDLLGNVAIIAAGIWTMYWVSLWPDLLAGLLIMAINADAARDVYRAALKEDALAVTKTDTR